MSKRVVAIRILGVGETDSTLPAVFTTREITGLGRLVAGTVVSLSDQLSSEIAVFGSMGSDSTTSFTVLSTPATRRLLLSRGKVEVYDAALNQPVRLTGYVNPKAGPVFLPVNTADYGAFTVGNYYRVQNTVFKITSNVILTGVRVWGCASVPIAMTQQGVGTGYASAVGSKFYDLNDGNPLGGCEQLPVVISTLDADGYNEEVIFRGYVNKVSNDTSSGQQNLIKVDCSSMMAYLKQAPFIPAWGAVTATATRPTGILYQTGGNAAVIQTQISTFWTPYYFGERFDPANPQTGDTVVNLWQVRQEGKGGISVPLAPDGNPSIVVENQIGIEFDGTSNEASSNNYAMVFNEGYYDIGGKGPPIELNVDVGNVRYAPVNGTNARTYTADATAQSAAVKGENCVESPTFTTCIVDLLMGCYAGDITLASGARSANEAAWLPYPINEIGDLIDTASLTALTEGLDRPDVVLSQSFLVVTDAAPSRAILPYQHNSAKTVGDVLEEILKRLGAYMVYDKGKFWFGSWAGARQTPVYVTDTALAEPAIKLTFERGLSLMRVKAKYCVWASPNAITYEVPYLNVDLASSGLGKEMAIGHWFSGQGNNPENPSWGASRLMANAFGLIMRYSQSAARVDVSLRDSEVDLQVGQEVALSSQYIVNSKGEMGINSLTGYVLKAARSWQTPTTAYTIILPGYVSVSNQVPAWSCSARVDTVPGGDLIRVEPTAFTLSPGNSPEGAPINDTQAFQFTYDRIGTWYEVQLLDQYGTFKYQGELKGVDVANDLLELPGFDAYAVPGDIIVLADATTFSSISLESIWDVFQANDAAQVNSSRDYARKWVP